MCPNICIGFNSRIKLKEIRNTNTIVNAQMQYRVCRDFFYNFFNCIHMRIREIRVDNRIHISLQSLIIFTVIRLIFVSYIYTIFEEIFWLAFENRGNAFIKINNPAIFLNQPMCKLSKLLFNSCKNIATKRNHNIRQEFFYLLWDNIPCIHANIEIQTFFYLNIRHILN